MIKYDNAIKREARRIIENEKYKELEAILKTYDMLMKKESNLEKLNPDIPFWEYCCCSGVKEYD